MASMNASREICTISAPCLAGNSRASSGGETRQIRAGYEDRELYTRWVLEAFGRWKAREAEWGRRLLFETGRLLLAPEWNHGLETTKAALDKYHVPNERLSPAELRRRYPQMNAEGVGVALFEPTTGVLKAKRATNTTVNNRRVFELTFAFTARDGRQSEAKARTSITERLQDEREEPLLYNPEKPEDAIMLDEASSRPQFDESGTLQGRPVAAFFSMILPAIVIAANVLALLAKLG